MMTLVFIFSLLFFPVSSFFLPQNTSNPNHEPNYLEKAHLFSTSTSFRIKGLGTGISTLHPNNLSRTYSLPDLISVHRNTIKTKLNQNIVKISTLEFS